MDTRRSFLKKAGLLSGATGMMNILPATLQKALAIDPDPDSTFYDAEHIVFLMQENRSFDHAFGTLQGVRGYNDPRAIRLPDNNKVWLQTNAKGETYAPFRYDMKNSKITWMGGLPHSWTDQVDARNEGRMDKWLQAKDPGGEYKGMPFTMGYFSREDIPFYYALADSFTVCDHNFCSSLTGTTPNRMYFWSGTIRERMEASAQANVWNQNADHGQGEVSWKTYPERLEENNVSWKVYQNEVYLDVGLDEAQSWLDNFGDNPLEYFTQYYARMLPQYISYLPEKIRLLEVEIAELQTKLATYTSVSEEKTRLANTIAARNKRLAALKKEQIDFTKEKFDALPAFAKNIHQKAFATNSTDPHYHELTTLKYKDGNTEREIQIPKGDILKNFREDVQNGKLPTVSWLAAPEHFSDHPSSAWFGAWYISEVIDILTQNPEVWKKTIFVLTYDENDGYFDHIPPFSAPNPYKPATGKVSPGIDTTVEFVRESAQSEKKSIRESNIGLGYRVPMIIASPWTRGGHVCSEVFDHASSLQFLENFLEKKTGKKIIEENITAWRRTICGDLTSAFRQWKAEKISLPQSVDKEKFIQQINNARFKEFTTDFKKLNEEEITSINKAGNSSPKLPQQEKGTRPASPLPYELYVHGRLSKDKRKFEINFDAAKTIFGDKAAGCPFYVYELNAIERWRPNNRNYAVKPAMAVKDEWNLDKFENGIYHLRAYGPNGFYRAFQGNINDPLLEVQCNYEKSRLNKKRLTGNIELSITNNDSKALTIELIDNSYKTPVRINTIMPTSTSTVVINLGKSFNWYDVSIKVKGKEFFEQQFAGHVETGEVSKTDPLMGGMV